MCCSRAGPMSRSKTAGSVLAQLVGRRRKHEVRGSSRFCGVIDGSARRSRASTGAGSQRRGRGTLPHMPSRSSHRGPAPISIARLRPLWNSRAGDAIRRAVARGGVDAAVAGRSASERRLSGDHASRGRDHVRVRPCQGVGAVAGMARLRGSRPVGELDAPLPVRLCSPRHAGHARCRCRSSAVQSATAGSADASMARALPRALGSGDAARGGRGYCW
jgi:hypothetical protein